MATGKYATWQDIHANLRKGAVLNYGTDAAAADPKALAAILSFIHVDFEAELRMNSTVLVPIDEATSPDMFEVATIICGRRGTAEYLRQQNQNQGKDPEDWYVNWLTSSAKDLMEKLQTPHGTPEDAEAPSSARAYLPEVGTVTDTDDYGAKFGLANIASGASTHW